MCDSHISVDEENSTGTLFLFELQIATEVWKDPMVSNLRVKQYK
jgi:hypothetical protein